MRRCGIAALVVLFALGAWWMLHDSSPRPAVQRPGEEAGPPAVAPSADPATAALDELRGPLDEPASRAPEEVATATIPPFGRVVDGAGHPAPGALVRWVALQREDLEREPAWQGDDWGELARVATLTTADAAGSFAFDSTDEPRAPSFLWARDAEAGVALRALRPGESLPPAGVVLVLSAPDPLRVRVQDARGLGVAGATVHHFGTTPPRTPRGTDPLSESFLRRGLQEELVTDLDGRATTSAFPGEDVLVASAEGRRSLPWRGEARGEVELTLLDEFTIGGRVVLPDWSDDYPDYVGERRILVSAQRGNVVRTLASLRGVQTGEWGPVALPLLPGAVYRVHLQGSPIRPVLSEVPAPAAGAHVTVDLVAERAYDVYFLAEDSDENTIFDSEVVVSWREGDGWNSVSRRADELGYMNPFGIPAGRVTFSVSAPGYATITTADGVEVPVDPPITYVVELPVAARVEGRVTKDGEPVRDFEVVVYDERFPQTTRKEQFHDRADGSFTIEDLTSGELLFSASGESNPPSAPVVVAVAPGETARVELRLSEAWSATGRVVDRETGAPVPTARVGVRVEREKFGSVGPFGLDRNVEPDGSFTLRGVPPGSSWIFLTAPGYADALRRITLKKDGANLGDLTLLRTQALEIRLVGFEEVADPTTFQARLTTQPGSPLAAFDAAGVVRFEEVSPGPCLVRIEAPQRGWAMIEGDLTAGAPWVLSHRVGAGKSLAIRTVPDPGHPERTADAAYVTYRDRAGRSVKHGLMLEDGAATVTGIDAMEVSVRVATRADWKVLASGRGTFGSAETLELVIDLRAEPFDVRVVTPEGASIQDAVVTLVDLADGLASWGETTDADGVAHFLAAPPGPTHVRIAHQERGERVGLQWPGGGGEATYELSNDASLRVRLVAGDRPVRGASCVLVDAQDARLGYERVTDADGRALWDGLSPARAFVRIVSAAAWDRRVPVEIAVDAPEVVVELRPLGGLELELVDAQGAPLAGGEVSLRCADLDESVAEWLAAGRVRGSLRADARGLVLLEGLPAGRYRWSTSTGASGEVEVVGGETTRASVGG